MSNPAERASTMEADPHRLIERIASDLGSHGLILRGGFAFAVGEDAPPGPSGKPAGGVLLVGHGGPGPWPHFRAWQAALEAPVAHPLDTWSRAVIDPVAAACSAIAVYPSQAPYHPFQQWAMRAERLKPSPLGILMHPEFGLWHAYRGALVFAQGEVAEALRAMNHKADDPIIFAIYVTENLA